MIYFIVLHNTNNELYKQQFNKKINLGPFYISNISKDNEKIFVYNPSIDFDNNGEIVGVSRLTGRTFPECKNDRQTSFKADHNVTKELMKYPKEYRSEISSVIYWKLNDISNFRILNSFSNLDLCNKTESKNSALKGDFGQGIEDPRLFTFKNELWVYGHFRGNYKGNCVHSPVIFKLKNPNKIIKLYIDNMKEIEKNWMPFEYNNELYFEYEISPHIIIKCDVYTGYCERIFQNIENDLSTNKSSIYSKHLGGGAPPKIFEMNGNKYYLGFGHTRGVNPVTRKNFFYVFRYGPPFDIIMMGDEFDVLEDEGKDVEFGSGMLIKDNKDVIIACGISDCYSLLSKIPLEEILNSLKKL
jgi:predicted GH43/DUF377 family glycosyl hydrolase